MAQAGDKYKEDGVNIEAGDAFSKECGEIARSTYGNSMFVRVNDMSQGNFRGPRGILFQSLPKGWWMAGAADGVGTRTIVEVGANNPEASGGGLFAMTGMDITRWGGLPLALMNVFDVSTLGEYGSETYQMAQRVMQGLKRVADEHKYVIYTGETAELGVCVGSDNPDATLKFNWAGFMLGAYHPAKMILGDTLKPGQVAMVLRDDLRYNGISSVRKALAMKYGQKWWDNPEATADLIAATTPAAQYDRFLNKMHGWFRNDPFRPPVAMHLIVHLSGGAFESKLGEDILKKLGLSARFDNLFEPPEIMRKCAEWRGMTEKECYKTWNGGQGAIVVIDAEAVEYFIREAEMHGIEAREAGPILGQQEYTVAIKSQFGSGEWLYY
jgi:phosphoribosylaminoimidazole (AIR) synthetase